MSRIAGIVLAAGRSARMGEPKPLLRAGGDTFLGRAVNTLRAGGCDPVAAVVSGGDEVRAAAERAGAVVVVNADPSSQQIASLRLGLEALPATAEAALVLPVDHPLVAIATVRELARAHDGAPEAVIRPVHDGRPGHPTLFPRVVWDALRQPGLETGARSVLELAGVHTVDVPVDDPGILANIDTPTAYDEWLGDGGA